VVKFKIEPMEHPNKIINYWKKEKLTVVLIIIFGISCNGGTVLGPIYQGKLIDSIAYGYSLYSTLKLAVIYVLVIASIQILRYFKRFYIRRFANSTSATMRFMIYNSIMHKDAAELDKEDVGNLM